MSKLVHHGELFVGEERYPCGARRLTRPDRVNAMAETPVTISSADMSKVTCGACRPAVQQRDAG